MNYDKMTREELIAALKSMQSVQREPDINGTPHSGGDTAAAGQPTAENSPSDKFAILSDITAAAVFIYQGKKNVFVNPAAVEITGYSKSELLSMAFWEVLHPDFQKMVKARGKARQQQQAVPSRYDVKILTKNGEEKWLDFRASAITYNGQPAAIGTAFEITDRKRSDEESMTHRANLERSVDTQTEELRKANIALQKEIDERQKVEAELRVSNERYKLAMKAGKVGLWDWDLPSGEVYVAPNSKEMFGYDDSNLSNSIQDWMKIYHPDDYERDHEIAKKAIDDPEVSYYEVEHRKICRDGSIRWSMGRSYLERDENGEAIRIIGTDTDITDRKLVAEKLQNSEALLRTILEKIPDGIALTVDGKIEFSNRGLSEIFGYDEEEFRGKSPLKFIHPDDVDKARKRIVAILEGGEEYPSEYRAVHKNGDVLYLEVFSKMMLYDGKVVLTSVVHNITARKKAEMELIDSEHRYRTLVENSPDIIMEIACDGTIQFINHTLPQYQPNDVIGTNALDYLLPKDQKRFQDAMDAVIRLRETQSLETGPVESKYWLSRLVPLIKNGEVESIKVIATDQTEQKLAQQGMRESEEKYRGLFENASDAVMIFDEETKQFEAANQATLSLFGYSREEFLKLKVWDISAEKEKTAAALKRVAKGQTKTDSHLIRYCIKKDGSIFPAEINPAKFETNGEIKIIGALRDITERIKGQEALKRSEEMQRTMLKVIPDAKFRISKDGFYRECIPAQDFETLMPPPEYLGKSIADVLPADIARKEKKHIRAALKTGQVQIYEYKLPVKGAVKEFESRAAVCGEDEVFVIVRDITASKQAEEKLRFQENFLRQVIDANPNLIFVKNRDGIYTMANKAVADKFGTTVQELIGKKDSDFKLPKDEIAYFRKTDNAVIDTGKPLYIAEEVTTDVISRDRRYYQTTKVPLRLPDSDVNQVLCIATDISERKKAEQDLLESKNKYQQLIELAQEGIWVIDKHANTTFVNPSMAKILGYSVEEMQGRHLYSFMDERGIQISAKNLERREKGIAEQHDFEFLRKDGKRIYTAMETAPIWDEHGNYDGAIAGVVDLTERRHAEEELKKHRDQLGLLVEKRTAKLNAMNITLREEIAERENAEIKLTRSREQLRKLSAHIETAREEEKTRIARQIHDELGQVLTILQMDITWLERHFPDKSEDLLEKTNQMSDFLDHSVQTVQRISQELRPSLLDHLGFAAAIDWQLQEFQQRSDIKYDLKNKYKDLKIDKDTAITLYRVLQEALANIFRHAKATEVKVELKRARKGLSMIIHDNGRGITKEQVADPDALGLVGIRERILHLKGDVNFSGKTKKGTKIVVTVPLAE